MISAMFLAAAEVAALQAHVRAQAPRTVLGPPVGEPFRRRRIVVAERDERPGTGACRAPAGARRGALRTVLDGALVDVTNPKGLVFFAAVLPQFVHHAAGRVPVQMMMLGLVPVTIGLVTDTLWSLGASAARAWLIHSEGRLSTVGGAGGLAMIGLGVTVAATGRAD